MVKWELDLWYELWDRAGRQGLDTWYDPRAAGVGGSRRLPPIRQTQPTSSPKGYEDPPP